MLKTPQNTFFIRWVFSQKHLLRTCETQKKFLMSGVTSLTHSLTCRSGCLNVELDTSVERRYNISCSCQVKTQASLLSKPVWQKFIQLSCIWLEETISRPPAVVSAAPRSLLLWRSGPPGHGELSGNRNWGSQLE